MTISTTRAKIVKNIFVAVFWVAVWEAAALAVRKEVLVASPFTVLRRLWELGGTGEFWISAGGSVLRILLGFAIAVLLGILTACVTSRFEIVYSLFSPLMAVI